MKRWFKLVGYAQSEGALIQRPGNLPLVHYGQLEELMYSGTIPSNWPTPLRGCFLREALPGGLSSHVFRCEPPIATSDGEVYKQTSMQRIDSPYPWDAVVHQWPG